MMMVIFYLNGGDVMRSNYWKTAGVLLGIGILFLLIQPRIIKQRAYDHAVQAFKNGAYGEAKSELMALDDYKTSKPMLDEIAYQEAKGLFENKQFDKAGSLFKGLKDYADSLTLYQSSLYQYAQSMLKEKEYTLARKAFAELDDYADSEVFLVDAIQLELETLSPKLPYTTKRIETVDGFIRLNYIAQTGNPYGVNSGSVVGEYRKEVSYDAKQVGGMILIPAVVDKLSKNAPTKIFIPADIGEMPGYQEVAITPYLPGSVLIVDTCNIPITLSNPLLNSRVDTLRLIRREMAEDTESFIPLNQRFVSLFDREVPYLYAQGFYPLGQTLEFSAHSFALSSNMTMASPFTQSNLLSVGDAIVFLKDIQTQQPVFTIDRGNP
jgi:hypothetical protein